MKVSIKYIATVFLILTFCPSLLAQKWGMTNQGNMTQYAGNITPPLLSSEVNCIQLLKDSPSSPESAEKFESNCEICSTLEELEEEEGKRATLKYREDVKLCQDRKSQVNVAALFQCQDLITNPSDGEPNRFLNNVLDLVKQDMAQCMKEFSAPAFDSNLREWPSENRCACRNALSGDERRDLYKLSERQKKLSEEATIEAMGIANRGRLSAIIETTTQVGIISEKSEGQDLSYKKEDVALIKNCQLSEIKKTAREALNNCSTKNKPLLKLYIEKTFGVQGSESLDQASDRNFNSIVTNETYGDSCIGKRTYYKIKDRNNINSCDYWVNLHSENRDLQNTEQFMGLSPYNRPPHYISSMSTMSVSEDYYNEFVFIGGEGDFDYDEGVRLSNEGERRNTFSEVNDKISEWTSYRNDNPFMKILNDDPELSQSFEQRMEQLAMGPMGYVDACDEDVMKNPQYKELQEDIMRESLVSLNNQCKEALDIADLNKICLEGAPQASGEDFSLAIGPILHQKLMDDGASKEEADSVLGIVAVEEYCEEPTNEASEGSVASGSLQSEVEEGSLVDKLNLVSRDVTQLELSSLEGVESDLDNFSKVFCSVFDECKAEDGSLGKCNNETYYKRVFADYIMDTTSDPALFDEHYKKKLEDLAKSQDLLAELKGHPEYFENPEQYPEIFNNTKFRALSKAVCNNSLAERDITWNECNKNLSKYVTAEDLIEVERYVNEDVAKLESFKEQVYASARERMDMAYDEDKAMQMREISYHLGLTDMEEIENLTKFEGKPPMVVAKDDPRNTDGDYLAQSQDNSHDGSIFDDYVLSSNEDDRKKIEEYIANGSKGEIPYTRSLYGKTPTSVANRDPIEPVPTRTIADSPTGTSSYPQDNSSSQTTVVNNSNSVNNDNRSLSSESDRDGGGSSRLNATTSVTSTPSFLPSQTIKPIQTSNDDVVQAIAQTVDNSVTIPPVTAGSSIDDTTPSPRASTNSTQVNNSGTISSNNQQSGSFEGDFIQGNSPENKNYNQVHNEVAGSAIDYRGNTQSLSSSTVKVGDISGTITPEMSDKVNSALKELGLEDWRERAFAVESFDNPKTFPGLRKKPYSFESPIIFDYVQVRNENVVPLVMYYNLEGKSFSTIGIDSENNKLFIQLWAFDQLEELTFLNYATDEHLSRTRILHSEIEKELESKTGEERLRLKYNLAVGTRAIHRFYFEDDQMTSAMKEMVLQNRIKREQIKEFDNWKKDNDEFIESGDPLKLRYIKLK